MRKIIAIGGEPAVGKSTIMKDFICRMGEVKEVETVKLVPCLYNVQHNLYIMGRYPEGEPFGGTDRFSMAVQPAAQEFVTKTDANILFEGDRLFNQSFLEFIAELPDTEFKIYFIMADHKTIADRHVSRNDTQSDVFKKGRRTKIENLRSNMTLMGYSYPYSNELPEDRKIIVHALMADLLDY